MKKFLFFFITLIFFLGCQDTNSSIKSDIKKDFIPFTLGEKIELKSIVGGKITLIRTQNGFKLDSSDKIIMFDIFATFCEPCKMEASRLMDFQIKNSDNFMILALDYLEDVTDQYILDNFSKKYNAYYFISNSKQNERIIQQILRDINFDQIISIPIKVILKNGEYQKLENLESKNTTEKIPYYIGEISLPVLEKDFSRIKNDNKR